MALDKRFFKELSESILKPGNDDIKVNFIESEIRLADLEANLTIAILAILNNTKPDLKDKSKDRIIHNLHRTLFGKELSGTIEVTGAAVNLDGVIKNIIESLKKGYIAQHISEVDQPQAKPKQTKVSKPKKDKQKDKQIEQFTKVMEELVNKNKGRKTLIGIGLMKDLLTIIEKYKGDSELLKGIQSKLNKSRTKDAKLKVVQKFIKSVIK